MVANLMVLVIMAMWRWQHRCWYNVFIFDFHHRI